MRSDRSAEADAYDGTPLAGYRLKGVQLRLRTSESGKASTSVPLGQTQFANLYETHLQRVYGFVFNHVGNREDAEDITSQVFIKAYKNLRSFEGRGSLQGWLFQIARSAVADFWRERYKLPAIPLADSWDVPSSDGVPELDSSAREQRVRLLLAQLPENYREVLVQRFLLRSSIAETARSMGITEANTRVLQLRALRRAAELARDGNGDGG